jgi:rhamnosyltransferase
MVMNYPTPSEICAIITTFHPEGELYKRVERVRKQLGLVVIINDGESYENVNGLNNWFENTKKVHLHHNITNVGIAASLNIGVSIAKSNNYKWILTLDDDSFVVPNIIERLIFWFSNIKTDKPIGLIGMSWIESHVIKKEITTNDNLGYSEKRGLITSGSFFSIDTYDIVGPFREEFFIDSVDYDYCLRARDKGFAVIKLDEIGFEHSLGRSKAATLLGWKITIENHEAFRIYYGFRNSTVLALEYLIKDPFYSLAVLLRQIKILFIVLIFEKNKKAKLHSMIRGIKDGFKKNLGKRIEVSGS